MKNNLVMSLFLALLFLSAAITVYLMYSYDSAMHKIQRIAPSLQKITEAEALFNAMVKDTEEYYNTTKNPEMMRLLQGMVAENRPAAPKAPAK